MLSFNACRPRRSTVTRAFPNPQTKPFMIQRRTVFYLAACVGMAPALAALPAYAGEGPYFPALGSRERASSDPAAAGWDTTALEALLDFGQAHGSTGIVIVQYGRIVAERYWPLTPAQRQASGRCRHASRVRKPSPASAATRTGRTPVGRGEALVAGMFRNAVLAERADDRRT